eukprot:COSAG06_NODE_3729_length_4970_cov_202.110655_2_plen_463_part_00
MCASWTAANVQAFISPSRSPTSSPPPRRQWEPLPQTASLPPRNIAATATAATRSATAPTDLAHPIVAAEVAFSLLTRPAEASAFFATSTATAAAWRSVWRGENTSALYFRQDGFQLDTSFLPQIRAMSKSLFELQKKERTLAAALKTEEAGHRKSKERLKVATAMKHGYKDGWAEEKTEREGAAADAELRAEENKELDRMLWRAHRRGFRPDESSEPPDESSEPPDESSDSEDEEDEEAWADLEGVTLTLRALNPSGSWGLGCRWQACIAWIVVFSGCSTVKCVDLLVGVLRFAGAEVLNVPADTEAAAKNAIFVSQEMAMAMRRRLRWRSSRHRLRRRLRRRRPRLGRHRLRHRRHRLRHRRHRRRWQQHRHQHRRHHLLLLLLWRRRRRQQHWHHGWWRPRRLRLLHRSWLALPPRRQRRLPRSHQSKGKTTGRRRKENTMLTTTDGTKLKWTMRCASRD